MKNLLLPLLALSVVFVVACGDDGGPADGSGEDAADALGDTTNDSVDDDASDSLDDGNDSTSDTSGDLTLRTGALDINTACGNSFVEVPYQLRGGSGTYRLVVELSDSEGSFENAERIGSFDVEGDGRVEVQIDDDTPTGEGYRVRVVLVDEGIIATDNGEDITILGEPNIQLDLATYGVLQGEEVRIVDNSSNIASRTWTFSEDASPNTSTDVVVDVSFSEPGFKDVLYRGTTENGCVMEETISLLRVVSCNPELADDTETVTVIEDERRVGGGYSAWLCGGAYVSGFGGVPTILVEPGATFAFDGGGHYLVYVKDGGAFVGGSGGIATVVYEPGAIVGSHSPVQNNIVCDSVEFDRSNVTDGGCIPTGVNPDDTVASAGDIGSGPFCPGSTIDVPVTVEGSPGDDNLIIPQLSDETGNFVAAQNLSPIAATQSGTIDVTLPDQLPAGDGYRLRLVTSQPPTIGPQTEAFEVPDATVASFELAQSKALVGDEITFTNTSSDFVSATWDFGDGASPATSNDDDGVTAYTTPGYKTVTLTLTDSLGCESSATVEYDPDSFGSGFEVLSCEVPVAADALTLEPGVYDRVGGVEMLWVCGGATAGVFGGLSDVIVEENGRLEFRGGGEHTFYVSAGAQFIGGSGGISTLVYETGALLANEERITNVFECPTLTIDTSQAPTPTCQPFTPPEPSLSIGEPELTEVCHEDSLNVPFSVEGLFAPDNRFRLQLSDASGSFENPTEIGSTDAISSGQISARIRAADVPAGAGYRLRIVSDDPALVSEPAAATIEVQASPELDIEDRFFVEHGVAFSYTNNTPESDLSYVWTVDDEQVSTERDPSFTFTDYRSHRVEVVATTSAGCEADENLLTKVYSCSPVISSSSEVLTSAAPEEFGGLHRYWICDGGSIRVGAGDGDFYVEDGGELDVYSGGVFISYVKDGASYTGASSGLRAVVYEPGADLELSGNETLVVECPSLEFDTSQAPVDGCGE